MMVTLTQPWALLLLLGVPLYFVGARRRALGLPVPRAAELAKPRNVAVLLAWLPAALRAIAIVLLALAISGPISAGAVVEERREGIPIVLAIDISSSMLAQDFRPRDRLEVAKSTIAAFAQARAGDPIGLVAFAGEAITLVPVTTHAGVVVSAIESLRIGLLEDGTAIGEGLATAVNRLRHLEEGSGVIVLLSDGENNRGIDPEEAAEAASVLGIPVYTVGVGSEGVAPVPVGAAPAGYRYAELPVGVDEELLRRIAERTGGAYFRATDPAALQRIYAEIDRLVPSVVETIRHVESVDWTLLLLLAAGVAVLGEWSLRASRWGALP